MWGKMRHRITFDLARPGLLHENQGEDSCQLNESWGLFCGEVKEEKKRRREKKIAKKKKTKEKLKKKGKPVKFRLCDKYCSVFSDGTGQLSEGCPLQILYMYSYL